MLDDLADVHGATVSGHTFRAMAAAWRRTEVERDAAHTENSQLNAILNRAYANSRRLEHLAQSVCNALASHGTVRKTECVK